MSFVTITLYGAETDLSLEYPPVGSITLKSAGTPDFLVSHQLDIIKGDPEPEGTSHDFEFSDSWVLTVNKARIKYTFTSTNIYYPSEATSFEDYYPYSIFEKRYKWIWFNTYNIVPDTIKNAGVATAMAVNMDWSIEHNTGYRRIVFELRARQ